MEQVDYNLWSFLVQTITAVALTIFAILQWIINFRLKKLQDYVGISIVPFAVDNKFKIQIKNTGKLNLYLHKYEIDGVNESYEKPRMLACGSDTTFIITVPANMGIEMPVKLYLTNEFNVKYLSTGAVIIDPISAQVVQTTPVVGTQTQEQQAIQQVLMRGNIRGWSYRTEKFDWKI